MQKAFLAGIAALIFCSDSLLAQSYERRHNTIAHRILDFESVACDVEDAHYRVLDHIIDQAVQRVVYDSKISDVNKGKEQAVEALKTIANILNGFGFELKITTANLCDTLTIRKRADGSTFHLYDCDTSSFIYLGIAEKLGIPMSFIEVENLEEIYSHNFVRWSVSEGVDIDWDTNHRYVRKLAKPHGVYGAPFSETRLKAYLAYLRALRWQVKKEFNKEIGSYRLSCALDPALPHASNNLAWAFVADQRAARFIQPAEALRLAKHAVATSNDPNYLDTLAGVHAELGNFARAIEIQREVVSRRPSKEFAERLDGYLAGKTVKEQK